MHPQPWALPRADPRCTFGVKKDFALLARNPINQRSLTHNFCRADKALAQPLGDRNTPFIDRRREVVANRLRRYCGLRG
jgi:hypothetical protein